jgi:hypothetical protein
VVISASERGSFGSLGGQARTGEGGEGAAAPPEPVPAVVLRLLVLRTGLHERAHCACAILLRASQFREFFIGRGCGLYSDGLGRLRRLHRRFGLRFETVFGPMFGA